MAQDNDEENEFARKPGLEAAYTRTSDRIEFRRVDPVPAVHLDANSSPDTRLAAGKWSARWTGVLEVRPAGEYTFSIKLLGSAVVRIDGKESLRVSHLDGPPREFESQPLNIEFGLVPIEVEYTPAKSGAVLRLSWQAADFRREPIPSRSLGHKTDVTDSRLAGWRAIEEHSCATCHLLPKDGHPAASALSTLVNRPGPHLHNAAERLTAEWIADWLANPTAFRPEAVMPRLFTTDRMGDIERYAVAVFLSQRGKPPEDEELEPDRLKSMSENGAGLYQRVGCAACHESYLNSPAAATLVGLRKKYTLTGLARYLRDPAAHDPSGRMPTLAFSEQATRRLAAFLLSDARNPPADSKPSLPTPPTAAELKALVLGKSPTASMAVDFAAKPLGQQLELLARKVLVEKRCANCHQLETEASDSWPAKPAKTDFVQMAKSITAKGRQVGASGCMQPTAAPPGATPIFGESLDRQAAADFLSTLDQLQTVVSPIEESRRAIVRYRCTSCHERNGLGGLPTELVSLMITNQTEQDAEAVHPPSLTGVADKLLSSAFHAVLVDRKRSRPWMGLQMPHFPPDSVSRIPTGLAAENGTTIQTESFRPVADQQLAAVGRNLLGERTFGCNKCHDLLGVASTGTRGPELSVISDRLTYDWYRRWMFDPQRVHPGTRMPTFFNAGKSPYPDILDGDIERQSLALWHYLIASPNLGPPPSLRSNSDSWRTPDKTVLLRTFLPDVTPRSMALAFPGGLNAAYDAQTCRLAYIWTGDFLGTEPIWGGRGGGQGNVRGTPIWRSPDGFPWDVTASPGEVPDFSKRGTDTSLGAQLPADGKLHPSRVQFKGYKLAKTGPTYRYELELPDKTRASFTESIEAVQSTWATGTQRNLSVASKAGQTAWFHAAKSETPPEYRDRNDVVGLLDSDNKTAPATAAIVCRSQGRTHLIHVRNAPEGAIWQPIAHDGGWLLVFRTSVTEKPAAWSLVVWTIGDAAALPQVLADELPK